MHTTEHQPQAAGLSPGARAALELRIQDARRDLDALIAEKNSHLSQADVCSALACEPGRSTVANNQFAASLRLKAFTLAGPIHEARLKVANLESQLKSALAQVAPAVTAEMCAAQDDTMNFAGVAA